MIQYCNYDIKGTLATTGTITSGGVITAPGGNSSQWNAGYANSITGLSVSGTTTKTLTATQQDGGTITASWADDSGSNNYLTSLSFNTGNGILTAARQGLSSVTVDLDGRYVTSSGVTSVATTNGITGGTITSTGTIQVDSTVVRTSGTQTIGGSKTFSSTINGNSAMFGVGNGFTTQRGTGTIATVHALSSGTTGLFPTSNNANFIFTLNKHSGNYYSQLGFSSNGNLYYRNFNNVAINTTQGWSQIAFTSSIPTVNNGTLTMTTSTGLDGGATFTANQSGNSTFAVTLDLTEISLGAGLDSTATGLTLDLSEFTDMTAGMNTNDEFIVLDSGAERRKRAGEIGLSIFNNDAGFITSSSIPSVGNGQIDGRTSGIGLSGSMDATANQSGNTTFTVTSNATTSSTGSTLVARDASGDINVRLLRSEYDSTNASIGFVMTQVDTGTNNYVRPSTMAQLRSSLNVANGATANTGTVTSVGISHAGNAFNTGSAVTTSGTLAVTMAGNSAQYVRGDGNLATFPSIPQGDITSVTAGTNLNGGGTSGAVTLNLDSAIELTQVQLGSFVTLSESSDRADLLYVNSSTSTWGGLQIGNTSNEFIFSLMGDGSVGGIYDDQNADWLLQWTENSAVRLYYNGGQKLTTTNTGVTITGTASATTFSGALNGNATTAARLQTARTIAGVSFNGSANISLNNNAITNGAGYITSSSIPSVGNGTLTVQGTTGLAGSGTFTANQSGNTTITLTNSAPNIVQTTVSGNAGTATRLQTARTIAGVSFNGTANISLNNNAITNGAGYTTNTGDITSVGAGTFLTGGGTSGAVTLNVSSTTAATASTLVARDGSADISARLFRANYANQSTISGAIAFRVNNSSDNYLRYCSSPSAIRAFIGAGTGSGDITGVTAGTGMTGGGSSGSVTLNVIGGDGITANADNIVVDGTVVRTSGTQSIAGAKTFTTTPISVTRSTADSSTYLATTAFVKNQGYTTNTGTMTDFRLTADAGGIAQIDNGETVDIQGGTLISTARASNTIIINNDLTNNNQLTNGAGYTNNVGDITAVTAGTGMTGGGTSGSVTLNVIGGTGITANANNVAVDYLGSDSIVMAAPGGGPPDGDDYMIYGADSSGGSDSKNVQFVDVPLSIFDNDAGFKSSAVTSIATTSPILGGTITSTGTLSLKVPVSGAWHNGGVAIVGAVTEVGRYIDFHTSNTGTSDFDIRLDANGSELNCSGNIRSQGNLEAVGNMVAGYLRTTNGLSYQPSHSFTSDTNTGMYRSGTDQIGFSTGGSRRVNISNGTFYVAGNLGAGTTGPLAKLHVNGTSLVRTSTGVGDFYLGNVGSGNYFRFHTNNSETFFGMNCGTIRWRQGSSTRFYFYPSTANMTINGTLTQNSDSRVKENVVEIDNCISKVQAMRGVYYNRTDFNTETTKVGVIAQEVEAVLPELILESPDDGLKSVAYAELTAVLINAIKEQQEIIEDLKTRIIKLEK